ncbi:MAG: general stress protein [candidate division Zixibacteria bacterium]|nr:general stress protein [candidate division Zixibacteria bacterium]
METKVVTSINREVSRIGLGTWAIGGTMWGGTDETQSIDTILKALDIGINLIDTAPAYGFGLSEEIVGKAVNEYGNRDNVIISTKAGLEWDDDGIHRNSSRSRITKEIEDSLKRLNMDYVDIYFIHWPDSSVPFEETAEAMNQLFKQGSIRAIGVSNFTPKQMDEFRSFAPVQITQPPYNIFEREIEDDVIPYCKNNKVALMTYGVLCRGLLTVKMHEEYEFKGDDLRKIDPKFKNPAFKQYLNAVNELDRFAQENYGKRVIHLAARWVLDKGIDIALWGARKPEQLDAIAGIDGWKLDEAALAEVQHIVRENLNSQSGPEFMQPPQNK